MPRKAESRRIGGLQNILGMHNDEWHKERGLSPIENMCFGFNEKHSHAGKWQCCGENDCFKQEILSGWNFFQVRLTWMLLGWAQGGCAAGSGAVLGSGQALALAESCCERDYSAPGREQHCCFLRGIRGVLLSQHKPPELLLHQLKVGAAPCPLLHKRRHFWCILMASEVTEFPLMSCLSVEGCLATLNHLFFHSSIRV